VCSLVIKWGWKHLSLQKLSNAGCTAVSTGDDYDSLPVY